MDFSDALRRLKAGKSVKREGWNGKGMFLYLVPNSETPVAPNTALAANEPVGTMHGMQRYVAMKTADNTSVPWLCSQSDMLADDWTIHWEPRDE